MSSKAETFGSTVIGSVERVEPSRIEIVLDLDAPQSVAFNPGFPTQFPRVNGFVLLPIDSGSIVGIIDSIRIERSAFPKRSGFSDFGLVDLPFPLRKLDVSPVGQLTFRSDHWELSRGVPAYPSVGDQAVLPTIEQSRALVEAMRSEDRRVEIGRSLLTPDAHVSVDPDRIFGRHLAVLGNTGSGKSCSVAGLIRWSLDAARANLEGERTDANARFLVFDPNGEYAKAFSDLDGTHVFQVEPGGSDIPTKQLTAPGWLWNGMEWSVFAQASPGVQRPLLHRAIRQLRSGIDADLDPTAALGHILYSHRALLLLDAANPTRQSNYGILKSVHSRLEDLAETCAAADIPSVADELQAAAGEIDRVRRSRVDGQYISALHKAELEEVIDELDQLLILIGFDPTQVPEPISEDAPAEFDPRKLPAHVEALALLDSNASQHVGGLAMRLNAVVRDGRLSPIVAPEDGPDLEAWLSDYVGSDEGESGQVAIVDLSLVPSDVIHTVVSVIARVCFEALQRFRREFNKPLPTALVLEEAHTFLKRHESGTLESVTQADVCRMSFERIAREGRKFGLGLVLASQRPSEISPTVLSQCNTFLLHRLVNDRDQELVSRLVPDNLGGLLRELPSLPSRHAILMGWATPLPALLEMRELEEAHRPRSEDPDFWDVWTGREDRAVDWPKVIESWLPDAS